MNKFLVGLQCEINVLDAALGCCLLSVTGRDHRTRSPVMPGVGLCHEYYIISTGVNRGQTWDEITSDRPRSPGAINSDGPRSHDPRSSKAEISAHRPEDNHPRTIRTLLPELVEKLYKVNIKNFGVTGWFCVDRALSKVTFPIDVWCGLTSDKRARHFNRFLHQIWKVGHRSVTSTVGALTVLAPSNNSGEKPLSKQNEKMCKKSTINNYHRHHVYSH